jgi:hypothetical protein
MCYRIYEIYKYKIWSVAYKTAKRIKNTVEPLLSGPPLSGHPLLNGHISKSRHFCNTNTINYPYIKRPPLLRGRGHPKSGPKCCFMSIFTSIKRPACRIYLAQHLVKRAENKSRASLLYLWNKDVKNYVLTHATLHLKSFTPQKHWLRPGSIICVPLFSGHLY